MALLETCQAWPGSGPPSGFLGGDGTWTDRDRLLVHAWTLAKKGTCPECGWPRLLCETGHFEAVTRVCRPSAVVEAWQEQNKSPGHGVKVSARLVTADDVAATVASAPAWWVEKHMSN